MLEAQEKYFRRDMPVAEAMALHPRVAEVFAAFHLGGCSHCGISHYETIEQVCMAYGVEVEVLLEVLESLIGSEMESTTKEAPATSATASEAASEEAPAETTTPSQNRM